MIVQLIPAVVSLIAAGFSFKWKRDAKVYYELAKACEDISSTVKNLCVNEAEAASESLASCNALLIKAHQAVEEVNTCRDNVDQLGQHVLTSAKDYAVASSEHATEAKGFSFSAEGHSIVSQKHAERAEMLKNGLSNSVVETLDTLKESELKVFYLVEDVASHVASAQGHARDAAVCASDADIARTESYNLSKEAEAHVESAAKHVESAADHVSKAGTLSMAVTKAAQSAAQKTQRQAQCTFCERPVNKYTLRENGDIVCKHCSDRRK